MKSFIKLASIIAGTFLCMTNISAQVGTTNNNPHPSAVLDLTSNVNKGLLIPRISLDNTADIVTIPNPPTSTLVYNTKAGITGTGALGTGYYYYDGTIWKKLITLHDADDNLGDHKATMDLNMQGNKISFARTDGLKLTLTDNVNGPLFRHNSGWINNIQSGYKSIGSGQVTFANYSGADNNIVTERMRLNQNGYLGIGTNNPSEKLQVAGNAKIEQQLTIKLLPDGAKDKIAVIDDNGMFKRAGIDLSGLPKRYDYSISNLVNGESGSSAVIGLPVYTLVVSLGNACGRVGIASFTVCGNTLSYLGGQARDQIYIVTPVGSSGSAVRLFANIMGCADGGGTHMFNFTVSISDNVVTVQCNADNDGVGYGLTHTYFLNVLDY